MFRSLTLGLSAISGDFGIINSSLVSSRGLNVVGDLLIMERNGSRLASDALCLCQQRHISVDEFKRLDNPIISQRDCAAPVFDSVLRSRPTEPLFSGSAACHSFDCLVLDSSTRADRATGGDIE